MRRCGGAVLLMLLLAGCAPQPVVAPSGVCPPVAAQTGRYRVDPAASWVQLQVFRGGRLARLGHNHILAGRALSGYLDLAAGGAADSRAEVCLPVASLTVDEPALRAAAGPGFESRPDAAAIAGTRANLLGPKVLDAEHFPLVLAHIEAVGGSAEAPELSIRLTLHGITRTVATTAAAHLGTEGLEVTGGFPLRQSEFGMTPFSILGGALTVEDEVRLSYRLVLRQ